MIHKSTVLMVGLACVLGCSAEGSGENRRPLAPGGTGGTESSTGGRSSTSGGTGTSTGGTSFDIPDAEPEEPDPDCVPEVVGLLRDFQSPYSSLTTIDEGALDACPVYGDFQANWQNPVDNLGFPQQGIPMDTLGRNKKPVFSGGTFETITSADTFHAWYRDDPDCNQTFEFELDMVEDPDTGNLVYDSSNFFPLDGRGYGTSGRNGTGEHNYHFTFELHMMFRYNAGDVFSFTGDDDLYVFIDDKLVIDLGGAHAPMDASVELDTLDLEPGEEYPIDIFHAERSETESNFHIETSLTFTNCNPIVLY